GRDGADDPRRGGGRDSHVDLHGIEFRCGSPEGDSRGTRTSEQRAAVSTERVSGSLAASQQGTPIDGPGEAGWPSAEQLLAELPAHLDEDALEFLRAEYEHLSNSFISNEASGETRVNVFLGL